MSLSTTFPRFAPKWQEISPGIHERGFDPIEAFAYRGGKMGVHEMVAFKVRLAMPSITAATTSAASASVTAAESAAEKSFSPAVRAAWIRLRHAHPSLAARQDHERECFTYRTLRDESDILDWLADSLEVVQDPAGSEDDSSTQGLPGTQYLDNVIRSEWPKLLVFPRTHEIVLQAPHVYLDGPGGLNILKLLIEYLASAYSNSPDSSDGPDSSDDNKPILTFNNTEVPHLNIGLSTLIGAHPPTKADHSRAAALSKTHAETQPSMGLPFHTPPSTFKPSNPLAGRRITHTFPPSQTRSIISACKSHNLTPTHAFQTALITATARLTQSSPKTHSHFSNPQIVNWASRATPEFASRKQGLGSSLLVAAFPFAVEPKGKGFLELASEVREKYVECRDDASLAGAYTPFTLARREAIDVAAAEAAKTPDAPPPPPPSTPVLSSWGILERFLPRKFEAPQGGEGVEVRDFDFAIIQSRSAAPGTFLWTWRDEMVVTICWKEWYMTAEEMEAFLDMVLRDMLEGLGLRFDS